MISPDEGQQWRNRKILARKYDSNIIEKRNSKEIEKKITYKWMGAEAYDNFHDFLAS